MGVLEDVVVNMKSAVGALGKKTEKLVDISKLKINQSELSGEIVKSFESLGELVYNEKRMGKGSQEQIDECMEKIDDLYIQLGAVTEQISFMKNLKRCKNCGQDNSNEMLYCGKCGQRLDEINTQAENISEEQEKE